MPKYAKINIRMIYNQPVKLLYVYYKAKREEI